MDLAKSYDFFQPETCNERIHIIGCGSVGGTVAELLVRFGLVNISLYDFDVVEPHNLANQIFTNSDINRLKVDAIYDKLCDINPECKKSLRIYNKGWNGQKLNGYVFLCVDSIELRKQIASENLMNPYIKAMFDFRTRLIDAQHYAADWSDLNQKNNFIDSMDFTHDEAKEATPVSACNVTLSVAPTVRMISNIGVVNFINFVKEKTIKNMILVNAFKFSLISM